MAATQQYHCKCCKEPFTARVADRERGWALYCSKSCKAIKQEQRTGQFAAYKVASSDRSDDYRDVNRDYDDDPSWDAHKNSF